MVWFIITALVVYLFYYVWLIRKYDKNGKLKVKKVKGKKTGKRKNTDIEYQEPKIPSEIQILIIKYRLDMSKINYRGLLKLVGFVCAIDIAFVTTVVSFVKTDNPYILLGVGALLVIPTILISFALLGKLFKKKGLVLNDKTTNKHKKKRK